jgi:hypothetical protein
VTTEVPRSRLEQALPWLWLAMSLVWAVVIVATDQLAWPLALWIATTVGPLTYLRSSRHDSESQDSNMKGTHR